MAVPTISSISPTIGPTSGRNVVRIVGTNFRLPPAPPALGYLGGPAQQTVKVTFQGLRSPSAEAATSTLILATVPVWDGGYDSLPLVLNVRVANLDDAGVEIPTENVTAANAYTIQRPTLTIEGVLQAACRELVKVFRRHLLLNTVVLASRDYDSDPATLARDVAQGPVIYLIGPNIVTNRLRAAGFLETIGVTGLPQDTQRLLPTESVDLTFQVVVYCQGEQHLFALMENLVLMFRNTPYIPFGDRELELRIPFGQYPSSFTIPNMSDLYGIRAGLRINGVELDSTPQTVVERGKIVYYNDGIPVVDTQER